MTSRSYSEELVFRIDKFPVYSNSKTIVRITSLDQFLCGKRRLCHDCTANNWTEFWNNYGVNFLTYILRIVNFFYLDREVFLRDVIWLLFVQHFLPKLPQCV